MKSPQQLTTLAAFVVLSSLSQVDATPFAYNPYMTSDCATTELSHKSPAFGGIEPGLDKSYSTYVEFAYPVITDNTSQQTQQSTDQTQLTDRKLEETSSGSNADMKKIENYFHSSLELNLKRLARNAAYYVMPWPSSYWPVFRDGINYRWGSNQPSAAEKYATAFGVDPTSFTKKISEFSGIDSMKSHKPCFSENDCKNLNDGSTCAIREGQQQGYCVPMWYGICHAWAPAALLEPEPRCAVEKNGVTFQPLDIKALLTQVYDDGGVKTVFTGARFDGPDSSASKDQYGRYIDGSRRDLGPGYMHVALANIIGRFNSSVVLDVTGGAEVWNQPVYSYQVISQRELTPSAAANEFYGQNSYPFNGKAQRIMYTETTVAWMVETYDNGGLVSSGRASKHMDSKTYTYLLELDNEYNILGGEWVKNSSDDHPDFLWFPESRPKMDRITEVDISYRNVRELLDQATNCA
ncbi:hypothetical protein P3T76_005381 [Phytophthora citrophthora]|uniref:Transglutaminase elicitor n=1 Tax=Phytophthora citrophthora TaxID=4793 RepID=A0AAD9LNU6_9STRA|nr:hypothetical protein P3T76_005381 [Phytophthora citrophthora]